MTFAVTGTATGKAARYPSSTLRAVMCAAALTVCSLAHGQAQPQPVQVIEAAAEPAEQAPGTAASAAEAPAPAAAAQTAAPAAAAPAAAPAAQPDAPVKLDEEMEDVKKALVKLKRDLVILEEDLLFPASSQVSVFLSMDVGKFFQLDAVTVKLNGKEVAHHLYTEKQVDALQRGGVQKLFVGNVKQGQNRVTAFFTGLGPSGRDFRRATTVEFEKGFEPTFIELAISDETEDYQPDFVSAVSN